MSKRTYECEDCGNKVVVDPLGRFPNYNVFCGDCKAQISGNVGDSEFPHTHARIICP
jgi:hypothetical protein